MDWNRAKDIIILFLVLLNVMLGVLVGINSRKYSLSMDREKVIVDVLASNNISVYCKITDKYKPMKIMELDPGEIDEAKMVEAFLGSDYAVMSKEGAEMTRYDSSTGKSLIIYENKVIFETGGATEAAGGGDFPAGQSDVKKLCEEYIENLGQMGKGFQGDIGPYFRDGEYIMEFRQKIDGTVIYDNYMLFAVAEGEIRRVEYSAGRPVGLSQSEKELCSPDEALFSFLKAMQRESSQKPQRIIEKMDIVYSIDPSGQDTSQASPCYRIYYTEVGDPNKLLRLCMVNAYLNTWRVV